MTPSRPSLKGRDIPRSSSGHVLPRCGGKKHKQRTEPFPETNRPRIYSAEFTKEKTWGVLAVGQNHQETDQSGPTDRCRSSSLARASPWTGRPNMVGHESDLRGLGATNQLNAVDVPLRSNEVLDGVGVGIEAPKNPRQTVISGRGRTAHKAPFDIYGTVHCIPCVIRP